MNTTFDRLYRQLGRVTIGVLIAALTLYGTMLVCAALGFSHAVASLRGAAASIAFVFCILVGLFLMASVVAAVIRWLDRRDQIEGSGSR
jgi:uncharacterized membrane protein (DUF485 family)